jgi:hypothetical protein
VDFQLSDGVVTVQLPAARRSKLVDVVEVNLPAGADGEAVKSASSTLRIRG